MVSQRRRPTRVEIHRSALLHNYNYLKSLVAPGAFFLPVIKANAYGHGAVAVAQNLAPIAPDGFAVATLDEAEELRKAGISSPIFLLGIFDPKLISELISLNVSPLIGTLDCLTAILNCESWPTHLPYHLKVDTGKNRLGFRAEELPALVILLGHNPNRSPQGVCTHLLQGSDLATDQGISQKQMQKFRDIYQNLTFVVKRLVPHVFNTDGLIAFSSLPQHAKEHIWHEKASLGARVGIGLYGYADAQALPNANVLKPVMQFLTEVVQIKKVRVGESVSYNATWTAQKDSTIGILPLGYADGYHRALSNKGKVFVKGGFAPIVGTICMDYIMIDITAIPGVQVGDEVELFGPSMPLVDLAKAAGTITYELLTSVSTRVPRLLVD